MKNKILMLIAITATAGLILWGCGGSSNLKEMPTSEGSNGETTEITVNAGAGTASSASAALNVTKDISGTAGAESDGEVDAPGEALIVTCGITYGSNLAGDILTPIVALGEDDDYVAACEDAFASKNRCVACRTISTEPIYDDALPPNLLGYSWCKAFCLGMVPSDVEGEVIPMEITFTTQFSIMGELDPLTVMFRQLGTRDYVELGMPPAAHPWVEADIEDIINPANPVPNYDLTGCDGGGGAMKITLVDPVSGNPLEKDFLHVENALLPRLWQKNFAIDHMGNGQCIVKTIIETNVPLEGLTTGMHTASLLRDPIILDSIWYDEITDLSYAMLGTFERTEIYLTTGLLKMLVAGGDFHFSNLTGQVKISGVAYSLEPSQITGYNIQFTIPTYPAGLSKFSTGVWYDSDASKFIVSDTKGMAWQLQGTAADLIVRNLVTKKELQNNTLKSYRQKDALVISGFVGGYMLDGFYTDVLTKRTTPVFTNERFATDYTAVTAKQAQILAVTATAPPNPTNYLTLDEHGFQEGSTDTVKLSKESVGPDGLDNGFSSELKLRAVPVDMSAGDKVVKELQSLTGKNAYVFGIENINGVDYYVAYTWEKVSANPDVWGVKSGFKRALVANRVPDIIMSFYRENDVDKQVVEYFITVAGNPGWATCATDLDGEMSNCSKYDAGQEDDTLSLNLFDWDGDMAKIASSLVFQSGGVANESHAIIQIDAEGEKGVIGNTLGQVSFGSLPFTYVAKVMAQ